MLVVSRGEENIQKSPENGKNVSLTVGEFAAFAIPDAGGTWNSACCDLRVGNSCAEIHLGNWKVN